MLVLDGNSNDEVCVPAQLRHVVISEAATTAGGGHPAGPNSRARVHAMIAIDDLVAFGLEASADKTLLGDPVIALGIRVSRRDRRLDTPLGKQAAMLDDVASARAAAMATPPTADIAQALRLTGRAANLSQVEPELIDVIHGGYRVANSPWAIRKAGRPAGVLTLRRSSRAWHAWIAMLDGTERAMRRNAGVELAGA